MFVLALPADSASSGSGSAAYLAVHLSRCSFVCQPPAFTFFACSAVAQETISTECRCSMPTNTELTLGELKSLKRLLLKYLETSTSEAVKVVVLGILSDMQAVAQVA